MVWQVIFRWVWISAATVIFCGCATPIETTEPLVGVRQVLEARGYILVEYAWREGHVGRIVAKKRDLPTGLTSDGPEEYVERRAVIRMTGEGRYTVSVISRRGVCGRPSDGCQRDVDEENAIASALMGRQVVTECSFEDVVFALEDQGYRMSDRPLHDCLRPGPVLTEAIVVTKSVESEHHTTIRYSQADGCEVVSQSRHGSNAIIEAARSG